MLLACAAAGAAEYPEKLPVFTYVTPEKWVVQQGSPDGRLTITAPGKGLTFVFTEVAKSLSLEDFVAGTVESSVVEKVTEQNEDGLAGYAGSFAGKLHGQPVLFLVMCFKGKGEQAVLGTLVIANPGTQSGENMREFNGFMNSLKGMGAKEETPPAHTH
jgi:hypothetical protein